jgi:predicted nucleotidyltransferase
VLFILRNLNLTTKPAFLSLPLPKICVYLFEGNRIMVKAVLSKKQIRDLVKKVSREAKKDGMPISRAFVFGSYARNKVTKHSDLDLCFVSAKFKDTIRAEAYLRAKIYHLLPDSDVPMDIVAYQPKDFTDHVPLALEIKRHGKEFFLN